MASVYLQRMASKLNTQVHGKMDIEKATAKSSINQGHCLRENSKKEINMATEKCCILLVTIMKALGRMIRKVVMEPCFG